MGRAWGGPGTHTQRVPGVLPKTPPLTSNPYHEERSMASIPHESREYTAPRWLDRALDLSWVNLEIVAFGLIMGAQANFSGKKKVAWLQKVAPKAEVILSVCTGNFIAGYAGLLDGLKATTHHRFYDRFEKEFPRVQLQRTERVVDNGKFVSGGGITAGIDAALHVVRRHFDDKIVAETIKYMEYRTA